MKLVRWHWYYANRASKDPERAVLPTILYSRQNTGMASSTAIAIGWWAWGFGVIRTVVKGDL